MVHGASEGKRISPIITLDDLIIGGRKVYQRSDQFKFSIDAVLLAHFCNFSPKRFYLDLGTGSGVLPLLGTALGAGHITGVEVNPIMASLAKDSVAYNGLESDISIVEADYDMCRVGRPSGQSKGHIDAERPYIFLRNKPFDGILVNPPYYDGDAGHRPQSEALALALHDDHTSLDSVVASAKRLLKFGGPLWMVYTASRLPYALGILQKYRFEAKRLRMVHSFASSQAKLVLIEARLGAKPGLIVEKPLCIYEKENIYSEEVASWYGQ